MVKFKKKFYVTTAIAYPNSVPHLGHALEIIQADVVARFHKLLGKDVFFQTGTDEHGLKNWQTAQKQGKDILEFLDANVKVFKDLYKKLNISYDYFIRTSDKKVHYPGAIKLWNNLVKAGDIYKQKYKGLYCAGCEAFKTEKELEDGKCPNHPTREIDTVEEENYFFKLSKYKDEVYKKIEKDEYKVIPKIRKNEILSWLKEAKDISFSRPKTTLPWGITVPGDDKQIMYVWCDALSNYITGVGYESDEKKFSQIWPADVHIIGKDILRFHAAFWPAMLISAKVNLPKHLFVHGFILSKGAKMSKSTGNVIEPFDQIKKFGVDQFRFYIMGTMPLESDGDYSEDLVVERINSELVSNLSNFFYRVLSFTNKNFDSEIKDIEESLVKEIGNKFDSIKKNYEKYDFKKAVDEILSVSAVGNKYFQDNEPWKLVKEDKEKSHKIIGTCVNLVKNLSIALEPITPMFAAEIQKQLNLKNLKWKDINFDLKNHKIGKGEILIKKIEKPKDLISALKETRKIKIKIDPKIKRIGIKAAIAQIDGVSVKKKHEALEKLKKKFQSEKIDVENSKITKEMKKIYKKIRVNEQTSAEWLHKFIEEKGKIPQINTVVDSYNIVSLKTLLCIGAHDINKIKGNITIRFASDKDKYIELGTGKKVKIPENEFVYVDDENNVLCRLNVKQGEYTKVDNETQNVVLIADGGSEVRNVDLRDALEESCKNIVKFCGGEYRLVESEEILPLDLKVGKVLEAKEHPDADKLTVMQVDLGTEKRQIVAGVKGHYSLDELKDKNLIIVTNLKYAKLRGIESQGMLLAGVEEGEKQIGLLTVKESNQGDKAYFEGVEQSSEELSFDNFQKIKLTVKDSKCVYNDKVLKTDKEDVIVERVGDGCRVC